MTASDLLARDYLEAVSLADPSAELSSICADSRAPDVAGALFVCMPSARIDTHEFAEAALEAGARAIFTHDRTWFDRLAARGVDAAYAPRDQFMAALGEACRRFYPRSGELRIVGVTGTNGKTTTAWMIRQALDALDSRCAYLGTLGLRYGDTVRPLENTTPFPVDLWRMLDQARRADCRDFVTEVSSHGLEEERVARVPFAAGVFTNLSQDHLDYHPSMEAYEAAKFRLFTDYPDGDFLAVLNVDDPVGLRWSETLRPRVSSRYRVVTCGFAGGDVRGEALDVSVAGIRLRLRTESEQAEARLGVGGMFNVRNALAAATTLFGLGYDLSAVARALAGVTPVPGRFEAIPNERGVGVLVDYAHTPDALEKLLASARELKPRRLIAVFGCGGDRDRTKRPKMAEVVSRWADVVVVTSDNPRTEDPQAILADIEAGLDRRKPWESIVDRREAIHHAIEIAEPGDIVVIAGKGHEDYQIIGRVKHPMDDREMAREALAAVRSAG